MNYSRELLFSYILVDDYSAVLWFLGTHLLVPLT